MKCIGLQHVAFEDLGLFADGLRHAGYEIDYRQPGIAPMEVDEWRNANLVVVLGGPIAAYDGKMVLQSWAAALVINRAGHVGPRSFTLRRFRRVPIAFPPRHLPRSIASSNMQQPLNSFHTPRPRPLRLSSHRRRQHRTQSTCSPLHTGWTQTHSM